MAWKFLNIGKANEEITRLNAEVSKVTQERDDARAALEANGTEVSKAAEEIQANAETLKAENLKLAGQVTSLTGQVATQAAEITRLNGIVAGEPERVKITVAGKVAEAQAAIGAPAAPAVPPSAAKPGAGLTGMARIRAAAQADLDAAGYQAKS